MSQLTEQIELALREKSIPEKAAFFPKFFKAFPGGYGEGDLFLGVKVPDQRKIAKQFFKEISLKELSELVQNPYHEMRLTGLLALVYRYKKCKTEEEKKKLVDFYLAHLDYVNNWDLVDTSCHHILGAYYLKREKYLFYELANSDHLWRQRVAMISSYHWIKRGDFKDALALAEQLKNHSHDLMHKAVGWMLREIGNQDFDVEMGFLKKHYQSLPRTALRYAIEKFPEDLRQDFLKGKI
ncbi:DNA alkylation repair protein [Algoriphagus formosus]|uniref:DNA alkylation repair protein n=1 Tax=Algoriphagus formosus TaxID=2007308 RepID=UPI003F6FE017